MDWINKFFKNYKGILMTVGIVSLPLVIIAPFPSFLLDCLLTVNITLAIMVLLTSIYVETPLQFSVFPSLLLITTLFRLVLNVASTRLILSEGYAGGVIERFSSIAASNDLIVGFVIFLILVVIQFVVITKGATRIAEVAARFTLDGMPGKQMAIDADLNAGLVDEPTARERRDQVSNEAEFYGAMDGAAKFVRGDAIAGIIITGVNIIGGLVAGMAVESLSFVDSLSKYVRLSIGDGLVSQIPAFILAVGAGLLVTRNSDQDNLGDTLVKQLFDNEKAMFIAIAFLVVLLTTGLPPLPLIALALGLAMIGYNLRKERAQVAIQETEDAKKEEAKKNVSPTQAEQYLHLDPMELEIGYGLIRLCDPSKNGDLVERISMIRKQIAQEFGFIVPSVRIRDNMQLDAHAYKIKIRGTTVASGMCMVDHFLAMDSGLANGNLEGIDTMEPAFNLPAKWITDSEKPRAEALGYTVVDASSVLATHLTEVIKNNADALLSREEVNKLTENLKAISPKLVEDVLGQDDIDLGLVQKVLQLLLKERVSIRDMETIMEVVGDMAARTKDSPELLVEFVRHGLSRQLCSQYQSENGALVVATLDPVLEEFLQAAVERGGGQSVISLSPSIRAEVLKRSTEACEEMIRKGYNPLIMTTPNLRRPLRILIETRVPGVAVMSFNEVSGDVSVETASLVECPQDIKNQLQQAPPPEEQPQPVSGSPA